ncbi:MAG: hypothetical protein ACJ8H8_36525 [Geminicoccaceae bacterium]
MKRSTLFGLAVSACLLGILPARAEPPPGFDPNPGAIRAGTYELDPSHGKITWTASHFGMSHTGPQIF